MIMHRWTAFLAIAALSACAAERAAPSARREQSAAAPASRPQLPGRVEATLFPPEVVLARASEIGLTDPDHRAIAADVRRTQEEWDALGVRLQAETSALVAELSRPRIDEAAARRAAEAVLRTESALKSTHLALLIRIKNRLTSAQQRALAPP